MPTQMMRAAVLDGVERIALRDLPRLDPAPHEVRIRVRAVGLCGTDLHIYAGHANYHRDATGRLVPLSESPQVLGHEIAGEVDALGDAVRGLERGDRVVVDQGRTCVAEGRYPLCEYCATGDSHQCEHYREHGITGLPGGLAEYVVVPAATTTLYQDLARHPDLCLPELKEPEILVDHDDPEALRAAYAAHFRAATEGQLRGEASTAYTKRPVHEGMAEKALRFCGPGLRIVYMRRDPVARALSHYRHDRQRGLVGEPFDEAVRNHGRFIDFGRYDWQIGPWIDAFGADHVLQFDLESYSENRLAMLERVVQFLGVDPRRLGTIDVGTVVNGASEQKHIRNPLLRSFIYSQFYQQTLRQRVPRSLRERARRTILPPPEDQDIEIAPSTARFILDQLNSRPQES